MIVDYKGGRTRSGIVSWVENQVKENLDVLSSAEAIKTAISSNEASVIIYGESAKASGSSLFRNTFPYQFFNFF